MKPVTQARSGEEGDCLRACVASLLELDLDEVPDLLQGWKDGDEPGWLHLANERLAAIGWGISYLPSPRPPVGWSLQFGQGRTHAHVLVCFEGRPVWDPTPGATPELLDEHFAWLRLERLQ